MVQGTSVQLVLHRVSGVMSMGKWGDEFFVQYGAVPSQLYRVPYTPDYDFFAAVNADRLDRFRRKSGCATDEGTFCFAAAWCVLSG